MFELFFVIFFFLLMTQDSHGFRIASPKALSDVSSRPRGNSYNSLLCQSTGGKLREADSECDKWIKKDRMHKLRKYIPKYNQEVPLNHSIRRSLRGNVVKDAQVKTARAMWIHLPSYDTTVKPEELDRRLKGGPKGWGGKGEWGPKKWYKWGPKGWGGKGKWSPKSGYSYGSYEGYGGYGGYGGSEWSRQRPIWNYPHLNMNQNTNVAKARADLNTNNRADVDVHLNFGKRDSGSTRLPPGLFSRSSDFNNDRFEGDAFDGAVVDESNFDGSGGADFVEAYRPRDVEAIVNRDGCDKFGDARVFQVEDKHQINLYAGDTDQQVERFLPEEEDAFPCSVADKNDVTHPKYSENKAIDSSFLDLSDSDYENENDNEEKDLLSTPIEVTPLSATMK